MSLRRMALGTLVLLAVVVACEGDSDPFDSGPGNVLNPQPEDPSIGDGIFGGSNSSGDLSGPGRGEPTLDPGSPMSGTGGGTTVSQPPGDDASAGGGTLDGGADGDGGGDGPDAGSSSAPDGSSSDAAVSDSAESD